MSVLLTLTHDEKVINFINEEYEVRGITNFKKEFFDELIQVNWYVDEKKLFQNEKTYIYTGSSRFSGRKALHQVVMQSWYGKEEVEKAYEKDFIIEHHNNKAFDCTIENLSFASNDINLAKAHSFDKTRPQLLKRAAVQFFKDFTSKKYQITVFCTDDFSLIIDDQAIVIERLYLVYKDNFRLVFTDANRIVDEFLENKKIEMRLLTPIKYEYKKALFYKREDNQKISGLNFIKDADGKLVLIVGDDAKDKFWMDSIPPNTKLYDED